MIRHRISNLFHKPAYEKLPDEGSSSGSGSPRKAKSPEWQTVDLNEVFSHLPPAQANKSRPPRAPTRLKKKNPGESATRATAKTQAKAPELSSEAKLFKRIGVTEEKAHSLREKCVSLGRALLGKEINIKDGELSMNARAAIEIFHSLSQADLAVACKFVASLHVNTLGEVLQNVPPDIILPLLEGVAKATGGETGADLEVLQKKLVAVADTYLEASSGANRPMFLDAVLNACPAWALPAVIDTIQQNAWTSNAVMGAHSAIDAWCKNYPIFKHALTNAQNRVKAHEEAREASQTQLRGHRNRLFSDDDL